MKIDKEKVLRKQVEAVSKMKLDDLKAKFEELYGFPCGATNVRNIRQRIIYKIQELYFGTLSAADAAYLDRLADADALSNLVTASPKRLVTTPGTRFCRTWKGEMHEAVRLFDGRFEYKGTAYQSLSAVAFAITGTHWNGKLFFGVK